MSALLVLTLAGGAFAQSPGSETRDLQERVSKAEKAYYTAVVRARKTCVEELEKAERVAIRLRDVEKALEIRSTRQLVEQRVLTPEELGKAIVGSVWKREHIEQQLTFGISNGETVEGIKNYRGMYAKMTYEQHKCVFRPTAPRKGRQHVDGRVEYVFNEKLTHVMVVFGDGYSKLFRRKK